MKFDILTGEGQNSPVSPVHIHHPNGYPVGTAAYNSGAPQWTGANTLTYTQSMQPPDHRHLHPTSYCKWTTTIRSGLENCFNEALLIKNCNSHVY